MSEPTLAAACGALGAGDLTRVEAIEAALPRRADRVVVDEPGCRLLLDREPLRWSAGGEDGVCWPEQALRCPDPVDRPAAAAIGPGVAGSPAARSLHASASGAAPIYVMRDGAAVYFASTVDALARAAPGPLSIDWEAWAAILTLGHPVGARTPFREIRRLEAGTRLVPGERGPELRDEWSWAAEEPAVELEQGAERVLHAMRAATRALPEGPLVCQLSGGLDSRLCLGLAAEERAADVTVLTADQDLGHDAEQRAALDLADAFGLPGAAVAGPQTSFWADLELLALRVDYQQVRPPWRVSMLPAMRAAGGAVLDGFGFDTFAAPGDRFLGPATGDPAGGDEVIAALWAAMSARRGRPGSLGLRPEPAEALWESARAQLLESSRAFEGHPSRALLTFYRARQARGIALEPQAILGTEVPVAMPLATDDVARAAMGIPVAQKRGGRLYQAILERLDERLRAAPSTRAGAGPAARRLARPSQSPDVAGSMRACLRDGPLAGELLPGKLRALGRRDAGAARVPRGLMGAAFLHLWHARYADRLAPVDAGDVLGLGRG